MTRSKAAAAPPVPAPAAPPPAPPREVIEGEGGSATWGVKPTGGGWDVARTHYKPKVDGVPLDLDLSWVLAPLQRKAGGFRPPAPPMVPDEKPFGEVEAQALWGPVPAQVGPVAFSMPGSPEKAAARRAHPTRASG